MESNQIRNHQMARGYDVPELGKGKSMTKNGSLIKNPALPGGVLEPGGFLFPRYATGYHSSPLFRAGHPGRSS